MHYLQTRVSLVRGLFNLTSQGLAEEGFLTSQKDASYDDFHILLWDEDNPDIPAYHLIKIATERI